MNKDNTVREAGGFIIQLMPNATDEFIDKLEKRIKEIKSVTNMLDEGNDTGGYIRAYIRRYGFTDT